ncbi:splicing regulatory glutamine/lysine-rich protein 1 isoform 1-T1 [Rhinophrynus dorsalis]
MSFGPSSVIQVTNLSAAVTSEQMRTLFTFLGDIEELRLYPPDNAPLAFSSKVCYVKYRDPASVGVAQHLTNTVFIDRALIVVPCAEGKIPEETKALSLLAPAPSLSSLLPGAGLLPIPTPTPTPPLASSLASVLRREKVDVPLLSVPFTTLGTTLPTQLEPVLPSLAPVLPALTPAIPTLTELPQPPLMGNVDPTKVDEIRRTIYVGNLNSQSTTAEQLLEFFKQVGDVRFVRMAGDETQPTRFAFVEFADQNSVTRALTFNGVMFGDRPLKINHSNNAIVKPPELTPQAAAKELEEVMKRVREAQSFISAAIEPETGKPVEKVSQEHAKTRSRSRSKSRSRRKRSRSKHSRSRSRNRSRSRHKDRRRSKTPHKKRSRSKDRRRSRSRSRSRDKKKEKEYKSKIREKDRVKDKNDKRRRERRSRSPSRSHTSVRRSRSASRERRKRRSRSLSKSPKNSKTLKRSSRSPSPRSKSRKEKKRGKERDHSGDKRERERSLSKKRSSKDNDMTDKYSTKARERDYINVEQESVTDQDESESSQGNPQHNGNCQNTNQSPLGILDDS